MPQRFSLLYGVDYGHRISFVFCPRCGERGLEHLKTYSHCVSCLHIVDHILTEVI